MKAITRNALALAATLVVLATPASAQLEIYTGCSSQYSFCLQRAEDSFRPIELADLQIQLGGGWSFESTEVGAAFDLFGDLTALPGTIPAEFGTTSSSLTLDFLSFLNGPDPCFPADGFLCPIEGFAVGTPESPFNPWWSATFVDLFLAAPAPDADLTFAWRATDIDGTVYASAPLPGGGGGDDPVSVPEPGAGLLLLAGLAGLAGRIGSRRQGEAI